MGAVPVGARSGAGRRYHAVQTVGLENPQERECARAEKNEECTQILTVGEGAGWEAALRAVSIPIGQTARGECTVGAGVIFVGNGWCGIGANETLG